MIKLTKLNFHSFTVCFCSLGVFALLFAVAVLKYLQSVMTKSEFKSLVIWGGLAAAGVVFATVVGLTYAGYIAPWSGRYILSIYSKRASYHKKK